MIELVCEDGPGACPAVETDCCDGLKPSCETSEQRDPWIGDVLVRTCRTGYGCTVDAGYESPCCYGIATGGKHWPGCPN